MTEEKNTGVITQEVLVEGEDGEIVPQENTIQNIDDFLDTRKAFIEKVNAIFVDKKDYHVIQGKKSMAKGGAEKIASILHWSAEFDRDEESIKMLGEDMEGLVAFKCTLKKDGVFVGEGRGASLLSKNSNDPNKTLKMAQKSAFIDAVLRTSGLSDFFTQDLEDMPEDQIGSPDQAKRTATKKQKALIMKLCNKKHVTRDELLKLSAQLGDASKLIKHLIDMEV